VTEKEVSRSVYLMPSWKHCERL